MAGQPANERSGGQESVALPVLPARPSVRPSRMSRRRATVLVIIHLLMIAHVLQWLWSGRTVSPIEPSEAMYTLNDGLLNAGFLFFAASLLATLVVGRFVCGWGCHFVAYQDFCSWLLKKVGIKPKAFRSRMLVFAPLALALYMFVWPSAYRWWTGGARPALTNHLLTTGFWDTFPGPVVGVLTILVVGFAIVYFFGSKGFCTYACPYGGFFGLIDQVSVGRIVVSDACKHCGHCTAVCTSNVRVHEEVALYGMVVDPGCMKCMDCVSVCPNDALHFGFAKPSLGVRPSAPRRSIRFDFTFAQEAWMVVIGVGVLLVWRGLYGRIPLLLAMGLAGMTAFLIVKTFVLLRVPNVRWQNLQLRRGGRVTGAGIVYLFAVVVLLVFLGHSGFIRFNAWSGHRSFERLALGDEVWESEGTWQASAGEAERAVAATATRRLESADRWGLFSDRGVLSDLVWLYLATERFEPAERAVRRLVAGWPKEPESHRGLAGVLRKVGRLEEAVESYRRALIAEPAHPTVRLELAILLEAMSRYDEAVDLYRQDVEMNREDVLATLRWHEVLLRAGRPGEAEATLVAYLARAPDSAPVLTALGITLLKAGKTEAAFRHLRKATDADQDSAEAHYNLGYALLQATMTDEAVVYLQRAVDLQPDAPALQYNLAVGLFMAGRPRDALPHARQAVLLNPGDAENHGFLAVVLEELGDQGAANEAKAEARRLGVSR